MVQLKDALIKSKQIKCIRCNQYKEKVEYPKWRSKKDIIKYACADCLGIHINNIKKPVNSIYNFPQPTQRSKLTAIEIARFNSFISNPSFQASSTASTANFEYIDKFIRPKLNNPEMIKFYEAKRKYNNAKLATATNEVIPNCPNCGFMMVKRQGRYGIFWGCKHFPYCKGTRSILGKALF